MNSEQKKPKSNGIGPASRESEVISQESRERKTSGEGPTEPPEGFALPDMPSVLAAYRAISIIRRQRLQTGQHQPAEHPFGLQPELDRHTRAILNTNEQLEELYPIAEETLPFAFQLQQGVLAVAGLADHPDPAEFTTFVINNNEKSGGLDYRRRLSMRLFDSLEVLENAFDGLYFTYDPEADATRFMQFVEQCCPSTIFEDPVTTGLILDMVREAYLILKLLAGPEAKHPDLMQVVENLKKEILVRGVGINNPDGAEATNYRVLAWHTWPDA